MFRYLFEKYKEEVYDENFPMTWDKIPQLEKDGFILMVIGFLLLIIYFFTKNVDVKIFFATSYFIGFAVIIMVHYDKDERKRVLYDVIEPAANTTMKKMVELLETVKIDVTDDAQLVALIEKAKVKLPAYDNFGGIKKIFKTIGGVLALFLPDLIKSIIELSSEIIEEEVIIQIIITTIISVMILIGLFIAVVDFIHMFVGTDKQKMRSFISNIEDIRLFKDKAKEYITDKL